VLVPVVEAGLNTAVTPAGNPEAVKATLPVKPPLDATVMVLLVVDPRVIEAAAGLAEMVKFGVAGAATVSGIEVVCERVPLVPVTVTVVAPTVAVLEAVRVSVLVPVVEAGLNTAVTPAGNPDAVKATLLVKPPLGATVIVLLVVDPWVTDAVAGLAEMVKFGVAGAATVSAIEAVCERVPLVPVTVTVAAPTVAVLDAVKVSVLVPVVEAGLNTAVTPAGNPDAVKATLPVKPPDGATVMALVAVDPRLTETLAGLAANVKFGVAGALTVRLTAAECVVVPLVPTTVTVAAPVVAVLAAVRVRTELVPVVVVVAGLKLAVTPAGSPVALKATALANPPVRVTVIVLVPLAPVLIAKDEGAADIE
jgi:hypothetical protein